MRQAAQQLFCLLINFLRLLLLGSFFLPSSSSPGVEVSSCGGCSVLHVRILLFVLIIIVGRPNRRRYRYSLSTYISTAVFSFSCWSCVCICIYVLFRIYLYTYFFRFFIFSIWDFRTSFVPFSFFVGGRSHGITAVFHSYTVFMFFNKRRMMMMKSFFLFILV